MPLPRRRLQVSGNVARPLLDALRQELSVPEDHPPAVLAEADAAAQHGPVLPPQAAAGWADATDVPFVTIDPDGSRDLDQALHLERRAGGYRVQYAIADAAAFVGVGGAVDTEAWARGVTLYLPDGPARLHPLSLSEGAASLLADGVARPALWWTLDLDEAGALAGIEVRRAMVRSRRQLSYQEAQAMTDAGHGGGAEEVPGGLDLLPVIGGLRQAQELARGGVSLQLPEQDVEADGSGYRLTYRRALPVEAWNAQLSLLTGMAAAELMGRAGIGIVRTLPAPAPDAHTELRREAEALGVPWPAEETYATFVRRLDPDVAADAALLQQAARSLRGAGYAVVGADQAAGPGAAAASGGPARLPEHAAIAGAYAHVTAPLRRLVDRYAGEIAVAVCAGRPVPEWVLGRLDGLPAAMAAAGQRASKVDAAVLDLFEALLLQGQRGRRFDAMVVSSDAKRSKLQLIEPAVVVTVAGSLPLGERLVVELVEADPARRRVELRLPA